MKLLVEPSSYQGILYSISGRNVLVDVLYIRVFVGLRVLGTLFQECTLHLPFAEESLKCRRGPACLRF